MLIICGNHDFIDAAVWPLLSKCICTSIYIYKYTDIFQEKIKVFHCLGNRSQWRLSSQSRGR